MIRRTYGEVKEELARVAGQTGLRVNDARLLKLVNMVQERLLTLGDWPQHQDRLKFAQYGGLIALPSEYQTLQRASVDRVDQPVFGAWYEFVGEGPGQQDGVCGQSVGVDRGEQPVIRQPHEPMLLRLYSGADERVASVRPKVRVFGIDEYGRTIRSESGGVWSNGIELELRGEDPINFSESAVKFARIDQILLPRRKDQAELFYVDGDGEEYLAGRYRHWETNPSFRCYWFPTMGDSGEAVVHALVRRRFTPIIEDNDPLLITPLAALRAGLRALAKEDSDKPDEAMVQWNLAAQAMADEAKQYRPVTASPTVDASKITGFGDIGGILG